MVEIKFKDTNKKVENGTLVELVLKENAKHTTSEWQSPLIHSDKDTKDNEGVRRAGYLNASDKAIYLSPIKLADGTIPDHTSEYTIHPEAVHSVYVGKREAKVFYNKKE